MANGKTKKMKVYLESTISGYEFMEAYDEH